MPKKQKNVLPVVETPVAPEGQVVETAPEAQEAKAKKARYAPKSALDNLEAVIETVAANPKRSGSKSFARYAKYHRAGQKVGEYIAAYAGDNQPKMLARNDLRWDLEHGFITIVQPSN